LYQTTSAVGTSGGVLPITISLTIHRITLAGDLVLHEMTTAFSPVAIGFEHSLSIRRQNARFVEALKAKKMQRKLTSSLRLEGAIFRWSHLLSLLNLHP